MSDALIVGGGLYGAALALHLAGQGRRPTLIEKRDRLLRGASFHNQARVHQGYHYPRALLTALRSHANYPQFLRDYAACIDDSAIAYYAIARQQSKVTAQQFRLFCARIGAPLAPAPAAVQRLFDPQRIEAVWQVTEAVFNADRLAAHVTQALEAAGVRVLLNTEATRVASANGALRVSARQGGQSLDLEARRVFLCLYADMNAVLTQSGLTPIALKQEVTELALLEAPEALRHAGVTVMCGPFFSLLPFPARPGLHTLSHVRYTPHASWQEGAERAAAPFRGPWPATHFPYMVKDAQRYLPVLAEARYKESLWAIKSVLPVSETDDSRPILYMRDYGLPGLTCILGGKIDNVYDMVREVSLG